MNINVGICFSKDFVGNNPLGHIVGKLPVYLRLLDLCQKEGWRTFVLTRKTYKGDGVFDGVWEYKNKGFTRIEKPIKMDLVYDRSAGVNFPPDNDEDLIWVNRRDFKVLAWDKWKGYQKLAMYMPKTFLLQSENKIPEVLAKIKGDWVVLKPVNGLKGMGIYIGNKKNAGSFKFDKNYGRYIAQEFIDTSGGISGITKGKHDLRIVVINNLPVWMHVRVPPTGSFKANAAGGGILTEVDVKFIPASVMKIVQAISLKFFREYYNPVYSIDFGISNDGRPYIFEINDQMGFPKWNMKNRENFLNALISNFRDKLK